VFGNVIVLMAIYRKNSLQTVSNFFICSLAASDLMIGLVMNPLNIAMNLKHAWVKLDHILMQLQSFFWIQMTTATTFSLCSVTLDRYICIAYPFKHNDIITTRRCLMVIIFNWAFSILFASLNFYIPPTSMTSLWIACAFITVVIPLTIISFCYLRMCHLASSHRRRITSESSATCREILHSQRNNKAMWTAGLIIVVFGVTFFPSFVVNCLQLLNTDLCIRHKYQCIWAWVSFISYISAATDPWIYAIRSEEFRSAFKTI
ncbi:predicted protein, partial [Nematostella vectensis]